MSEEKDLIKIFFMLTAIVFTFGGNMLDGQIFQIRGLIELVSRSSRGLPPNKKGSDYINVHGN